jgi:hypothetical protein
MDVRMDTVAGVLSALPLQMDHGWSALHLHPLQLHLCVNV